MSLPLRERRLCTTSNEGFLTSQPDPAPEVLIVPSPTVSPWLWPGVMGLLAMISLVGAVRWPAHSLGFGLLPFSFVGNSLAMVPYDWYIPAFVQRYPAWSAVAIGVLGTVVVEFWNMELLARILNREGTAGFRGHQITARLVRWFSKYPWLTLTAAGAMPIIPFYPCRILATLGHYPMGRYQTAVIVGRGLRYTGLAGLGLLLPIPIWAYFAVSVVLLAFFVYKLTRTRAQAPKAEA